MENIESNVSGSQVSISTTNNSNKDFSSTISLTNCQTPNNNTKQIPDLANNTTLVVNNDDCNELDVDEHSVHSNQESHMQNSRDVTSMVLDHRGGLLVNKYWGVSLEIPENALPYGTQQEIYFVITDPRTSENAPPLDLENGTYIHALF